MAETAPAPLVCGVDFSPESRRALRCADALALTLQGRLHLVSAVEPVLAEAARLRQQLAAFTEQVERDLREFAIGARVPADRLSVEAAAGEPAPVLLAAANRLGARAIVVGTRGWGQAARFFLGSTTLRLLRTTDRAVLVTDWDDRLDAPDSAIGTAVSRIVCGVDFSDESAVAARAAAQLATDLGAGLTLVHAVAPANVPVGWDSLLREVESDHVTRATHRLEDLARALAVPATIRTRLGSPADVLAEETKDDPRAFVAVGLRGGGHHRPGSTALRVLSVTRVPVLAIPE